MNRFTLLTLCALGFAAACSGPGEDAATAAETAFTTEVEACGIEKMTPMLWGRDVSQSGFRVQDVRDGVRNLRVWSEGDAAPANSDGVLTATAAGPAWIAADLSDARGRMLFLETGTVRLKVEGAEFLCEESPELAAALRQRLEDEAAAEAAAAQAEAEAAPPSDEETAAGNEDAAADENEQPAAQDGAAGEESEEQ